MGEEFLTYNKDQFAFNEKRVKEFLNNTGLKSWFKKDSFETQQEFFLLH